MLSSKVQTNRKITHLFFIMVIIHENFNELAVGPAAEPTEQNVQLRHARQPEQPQLIPQEQLQPQSLPQQQQQPQSLTRQHR